MKRVATVESDLADINELIGVFCRRVTNGEPAYISFEYYHNNAVRDLPDSHNTTNPRTSPNLRHINKTPRQQQLLPPSWPPPAPLQLLRSNYSPLLQQAPGP